jgi:hypothetical protein
MEVLKKIINKHMSFSIGTLFAFVIVTGVTACSSCDPKPSVEGKLELSAEKTILIGKDVKAEIVIELDQASKDNNQAAIYTNYKLEVEAVEGANGSVTYVGYEDGKEVAKTVKKGTVVVETLDHFIKGDADTVINSTESKKSITFTFVPDTDKKMIVKFRLLNADGNTFIDEEQVTWTAEGGEKPEEGDPENSEEAKAEAQNLLTKVGEAEAEMEEINIRLEQHNSIVFSDDAITNLTEEQFNNIKRNTAEFNALLKNIINASNAIVAKPLTDEIKGQAEANEQKAQQLLKKIEHLENNLDSKVASKNPKLLEEKVRINLSHIDSHVELMRKALGGQDENRLSVAGIEAARIELEIIENAKDEVEAIAQQLDKPETDENLRKDILEAAKDASDLAKMVREEYSEVIKKLRVSIFKDSIKAARDRVAAATAILNSKDKGKLSEVLEAINLATGNKNSAQFALVDINNSEDLSEQEEGKFKEKLSAVTKSIEEVKEAYNKVMKDIEQEEEATEDGDRETEAPAVTPAAKPEVTATTEAVNSAEGKAENEAAVLLLKAKAKLGPVKESLGNLDLNILDWNTIEAFKTVFEIEKRAVKVIQWVQGRVEGKSISIEPIQGDLEYVLAESKKIADIYTQKVSDKLQEAKEKKKAMHESMQDGTKSIEERVRDNRLIAEEALKAFQLVEEAVELLENVAKDEVTKMSIEAKDLKEKLRNEYNNEADRHPNAGVEKI